MTEHQQLECIKLHFLEQIDLCRAALEHVQPDQLVGLQAELRTWRTALAVLESPAPDENKIF